MLLLRSLLYQLFLLLSSILFSIAMLLAHWIRRPRWVSQLARRWGLSNLAALRLICRLDYRLHGFENLPDTNSIVLAKHQSAWETIALRGLLPSEQSWVLKQELMRLPFFGWAMGCLQPIAIDRSAGRRAVVQLVREGGQRLAAGRWVVIFPEGTRVAPGTRRPYAIGGALLAEQTGYPVVPIAHNAGYFWGRRRFIKYPGTIDMVAGSALDTQGQKAAEINERVENWIELTLDTLPKPNGSPGTQ